MAKDTYVAVSVTLDIHYGWPKTRSIHLYIGRQHFKTVSEAGCLGLHDSDWPTPSGVWSTIKVGECARATISAMVGLSPGPTNNEIVIDGVI